MNCGRIPHKQTTYLQVCYRACQLLLLLLQLASLQAGQAPQCHSQHSLSLGAAQAKA
jgi:hypothetical protein